MNSLFHLENEEHGWERMASGRMSAQERQWEMLVNVEAWLN